MQSNKKGFTIVEFMIAITIFTVAIMLVMGAVIFIGRQYQKGSNQAKLDDATRTLHQNFTDAIKFSGANASDFTPKTGSGGLDYICVGNAVYYYPSAAGGGVADVADYGSLPSGLLVKYNDNCNDVTTDALNILPTGAKVANFSVKDPDLDGIYEIYTNIVIAESDLVEVNSAGEIRCKSGIAGSEFCAQSYVTSFASKRRN